MIHIRNFGKIGLSNFGSRGGKEDVGIESSTKTNLLVDTLAEEIPTVVLRETEFEYQEKSYQ